MYFNAKRIVSLIVVFAMMFSLSGINVYANETEAEPATQVGETIPEETIENEVVETTIIEKEEISEDTEQVEQFDSVETFAQGDVVIDEYYGNGSELYPYKIRTAEEFMAISGDDSKYPLSAHYILMNDIEISSDEYVPIGDHYAGFTGVLDGDGYTITFTFTGTDYQGLFGINEGTVKNLTVSGNVAGGFQFGMLVGVNSGTIENCFTTGTVTGNSYIGGMVGINEGTIFASGSDATVTGKSGVGGLVGGAGSGTILNCYALGNVAHVNGGGSEGFGGLVGGGGPYGMSTVIRECYAAGEVCSGAGGGLVGTKIDSDPHVYNSYYHNVNKLNGKGFPVTADELKDKSTFYMWDFENIWAMDEDGYPYIDLRGETPEVEFEGEGTKESPYLIKTEKQLHALAMREDGIEHDDIELGVYYRLENDITVTAKFWSPINAYPAGYNGIYTFDGNGHTISGINISGINKRIGLFANNGIDGVIKNLTVSGNVANINGSYLWGTDATGILVGYNYGIVENCHSTGTTEGSYVGGLVGINDDDGTVKYSSSDATVTNATNGGGLVGENDGIVINSYANGNVSGGSTYYVGGLVGLNDGTVKYCYASGLVNDGSGGGLVGNSGYMGGYNTHRVYNSYYHCVNTNNYIGFPATSDELKDKSTFYMWDFENIWKIDEGGYPYIDVRGETPQVTFEGDGDADSPYIIKTERQLYALSMEEASIGKGIYYQLANDIEITAKYWSPIRLFTYNSVGFEGVFDGNGYTISGIKNNVNSFQLGLFGLNSGTIKNLTVSGDIEAPTDKEHAGNAGILLAYNAEGAVVDNCFSSGSVKGNYQIGGLVGTNFGTIKQSGSDATVVAQSDAGGLVGSNEGRIINSYAHGDVTAPTRAGGLVGDFYATDKDARIINCYSTGLVNDGTGYCLVGTNSNDYREGRIYNSYTNNTNNSNNNHYYSNGFVVSDEELKDKDTYYMWDFENIWDIDEGGYPYINVRGETPAVAFEGEGDIESPYLITTEQQLHAIAMDNAPNSDGIYYELANDIKLSAKYWTPIGIYDEFKGTFDGKNYTISGVKTSITNRYTGLFGKNNGTIKNLNVTGDVNALNDNYVSGGHSLVAGFNNTKGIVENCSATGSVKGGRNVGLLVSYNTGIIKDSTASGEVKGNENVGLLAGYNNKTVENCVANGTVNDATTDTSNVCYYIGGLVGNHEGGTNGNIINSGADATVYGKNYVGGLVGRGYGNITDCYARGSVTATGDYAGGLVGGLDNTTCSIVNSNAISDVTGDEYVGGFAGYIRANVEKCFAKGNVNGSSIVGGFAGNIDGSTVSLVGADVNVVCTNREAGSFTGISYSSTISNVYALGDVSVTGTGGYNTGAFIGNLDRDNIIKNGYLAGKITYETEKTPSFIGGTYGTSTCTNLYYDAEISGITSSDFGTGLTTAEMKLGNSYTDWDFADTWAVSNDTNQGYPYLRALVSEFGKGDVNADRSIDNRDATYLLRYLANWTIPGIAMEALDVDGSGEIDNKDATLLLRYLAGWEVTLD